MREHQTYVSTHDHDGSTVLTAVGEFDVANQHILRDAISDVLNTEHRVIIDMTDTAFVDSTVLGALVAGAKRATVAGGWLRLVNPQHSVRKVLRITSIDTVIGLYDSVDQAVEHGHSDDPGESPVATVADQG